MFDSDNIWNTKRIKEIQTFKKIASKIIEFIAQFENELVKIWNKPKLVFNSNYVITLSKLSKKILEKVAKHENLPEQIKEWQELGMIGEDFKFEQIFEKSNGGEEDETLLNKKWQYLPIDTKYFKDLEIEILFLSDNLDEELDGWLIKSENYQALNTLLPKFKEKVKCIYIDPPYNTGNDGFVYKDAYHHSSWLTMMENRLSKAREKLKEDGVIFISIDDNEVAQLRILMDEIFGEENFVGQIVWLKKNAQNDADNIEKNHEYLLVYRKTNNVLIYKTEYETKEVFKDKNELFYYVGAGITTGGVGGILNARPNLGYSIYFHEKTGDFFAIDDYDKELAKISNDEQKVYKTKEDLIEKGYIVIRPPKKGIGLGCWTWALDKFNSEKDKILIKKTKNGYSVFKKEFVDKKLVYIKDNKFYVKIIKEKPFKSFIDNISSSLGIKKLNQLFDRKIFENPKNTLLLKKYIKEVVFKDDIILDFFAGSGTTGDAVMQLNAEDGGNRKFILVEMADYFDTVIIPRIKKVAYSTNWKDGKPQDHSGVSIFLKYYELEQYENVLRNAKYEYGDLILSPSSGKDVFNEYIFMRSPKFVESALKIVDNDFKIDLTKIYPEKYVDIAETLSNLIGRKIKKITKNSVILEDIGEINYENIPLEYVKPLIWW